MNDVITIDGPSGAGKGTVARILAKRLGFRYLDTGALYRAVAWKAREENISMDDDESLRLLLQRMKISFDNERIFVDGRDISLEIRTAEIGELSSQVSAREVVRKGLYEIQRKICLEGKVVIEGRDTGTCIFPETSNKFFLDASLEERARRRFEELKHKHPNLTLEETIADLKKRDERDSSRTHSPLKRTDDMIYIDSTNMSIEEVVDTIIKNLKGIRLDPETP